MAASSKRGHERVDLGVEAHDHLGEVVDVVQVQLLTGADRFVSIPAGRYQPDSDKTSPIRGGSSGDTAGARSPPRH